MRRLLPWMADFVAPRPPEDSGRIHLPRFVSRIYPCRASKPTIQGSIHNRLALKNCPTELVLPTSKVVDPVSFVTLWKNCHVNKSAEASIA